MKCDVNLYVARKVFEENQMSANLILKMHPLVSLRAKFGTKYDELNLNLRHAIEERL